ncbi:hypothetical protein MLD38_033869 [Melastoma candidum]|uniref:Uncharacterized protein n=1 Tax=Melastoma candidum TaxID=119954 RepID=A0ACB9M890_9MYRT|nr:hypothetical protein MLD38_033869 [Melastoma candidum]
MDKEVEEAEPSWKGKELASSHGKMMMEASSSGSKSWIRSLDPRIVRVSRVFGGKDRHSKVSTVKGLRDRRVRLSVPTAIQLYDLQDRLGLSQPSKVVDWLLDAVKHEIDELPPLPAVPGTNLIHSIHHPRLWSASRDITLTTSGPTSKCDLKEATTQEQSDEQQHRQDSRKGSREQRQDRNGHMLDYPSGPSNDKWPRSYDGIISQVVFQHPAAAATQSLFPNSISATPAEDEVRQPAMGCLPHGIPEFPFRN